MNERCVIEQSRRLLRQKKNAGEGEIRDFI